MSLINKVESILNNMPIPKIITNVDNPNKEIEKELSNKSLLQLAPNEVNLLAYDLALFNNYAYKYYIFEFIKIVILKKNNFESDAFIQDLFESKLLSHRSERYTQFSSIEKKSIKQFLEKSKNDIKINGENSSFIDWQKQLDKAIFFWTEKNKDEYQHSSNAPENESPLSG